MYKLTTLSTALCLGTTLLSHPVLAADGELAVKITPELSQLSVKHEGETVVIMRNQDKDHVIDPLYAKTSRSCPPFCVTPAKIHDGVDTVGELEVLDYLKKISEGDNSILVIDSRTPEWLARGTIPGSVSIPWIKISPRDESPFESGETAARDKILTEQFGVQKTAEGAWDFSHAKTLVLFCNGLWCPQSSTNIHTLVDLGYPPAKLKWYRGGVQDWEMLGLTTATVKR